MAQEAFYCEFFDKLFTDKSGKVHWTELDGWSKRTKSTWIKRLIDLEIIERRRKGWRGRVYYKLSPQFLANINKLWRISKTKI